MAGNFHATKHWDTTHVNHKLPGDVSLVHGQNESRLVHMQMLCVRIARSSQESSHKMCSI